MKFWYFLNKFFFKLMFVFDVNVFFISIMFVIWFDLSHTPIWHQPEVGPCGKTIETIKELNEKKILRPNPKMKNLFSIQKQRGVTTSFCRFNTNELYDPCPLRKKKQNKIKKAKSNSSTSSLRSPAFCFRGAVLNRFHVNLCPM